MNRLSILTFAFAGANASLPNKRQAYTTDAHDDCSEHLENACYTYHDNKRDVSLPCNQILVMQAEFMYGPERGKSSRNRFQSISSEDDGPPLLTAVLCRQQWLDLELLEQWASLLTAGFAAMIAAL